MGKLQNPTDNTGYMPLKRHIASTVVPHAKKRNDTMKILLANKAIRGIANTQANREKLKELFFCQRSIEII